MNIKVGIVEDNDSVRENLAELIDQTPGFACVAACGSAEEALERLRQACPEVVLMDIHLPGQSGIACVARLRRLLPQTQVIMLTVEEDSERVFESLKAGATGYLVKHTTPERILEAVAEVHRGGAPMSSHIARRLVATFQQRASADAASAQLSPREEQILRMLATGNRSKEIGHLLNISVGTVNTHIRHIYEKLHVRSRAEAVARYVGTV